MERIEQAPKCLGTEDLGLHAATLDPTTPFLSQGRRVVATTEDLWVSAFTASSDDLVQEVRETVSETQWK